MTFMMAEWNDLYDGWVKWPFQRFVDPTCRASLRDTPGPRVPGRTWDMPSWKHQVEGGTTVVYSSWSRRKCRRWRVEVVGWFAFHREGTTNLASRRCCFWNLSRGRTSWRRLLENKLKWKIQLRSENLKSGNIWNSNFLVKCFCIVQGWYAEFLLRIVQWGLEYRTCSDFGWLMMFKLWSQPIENRTMASLGRFK